jgi:hypothetical protein
LWRWLLMGSVLTPLSASVLFLGVTCIECNLELCLFPHKWHKKNTPVFLLFTDGPLLTADSIVNDADLGLFDILSRFNLHSAVSTTSAWSIYWFLAGYQCLEYYWFLAGHLPALIIETKKKLPEFEFQVLYLYTTVTSNEITPNIIDCMRHQETTMIYLDVVKS